MKALLESNDIKLIRGLLKNQRISFGFSLYLTFTFLAVSVACVIASVTGHLSPIVIVLGIGAAILTYFLGRATRKSWQQVIHPLQSALRPKATKSIYEGKLSSVSLSGNGKVTYELDASLISVYPILLHNGLALLQESLTAIHSIHEHQVSLHVFELPDGRQLLLDVRSASQEMNPSVSTHRIKSQRGINRMHTPQEIKGTLTEIIKARARVQVMGESTSNNEDTWFRIHGMAYLIKSNKPLPQVVVGDLIELELS